MHEFKSVAGSAFGKVAALAAACALSALPAAAQETGNRNLDGVWKIAQPTDVLKPVSGAVPFTGAGLKAYNENSKLKTKGKIDDYDIASSRCSLPGVPRVMINPWRFKIWQRLGTVTFDFEWNRAIRQIKMQGTVREAALVPNMNGDATAHWEGDTLVSVTRDSSDRTLIDNLVPHSDQMVVTERYRLLDKDTLENRITIEDPAYFTRPWDAVVTYKRQPDMLFAEDVCLDRVQNGKPAFPKS